MLTRLALAAICACLLPAQLSNASLGYVRDLHGALRPLLGVAGAFVLGEPIATGITVAYFDSAAGCAASENGPLALTPGGAQRSEPPCEPPSLPVRIEGDEVVIEPSGVRLRTPATITTVERAGADWFILRTDARLYALRTTARDERIFELPEAAQ